MSATYRQLIELKEVIDHDCGNYRVGEIDFGISGNLDEFLKQEGRKGKEELVNSISYLIYEIERRWRELPENNSQADQACSGG